MMKTGQKLNFHKPFISQPPAGKYKAYSKQNGKQDINLIRNLFFHCIIFRDLKDIL